MENSQSKIFNIIKNRRSTRRFKPDLVSDEDLLSILDAARWAPSGENLQPWRFLVIKNHETMLKIVDLLPYKKMQAFLRLSSVSGRSLARYRPGALRGRYPPSGL